MDTIVGATLFENNYGIVFAADVPIATVTQLFDSVPNLSVIYSSKRDLVASIPLDKSMNPDARLADLVWDSQGVDAFWNNNYFHRLGHSWHLYSIGAPMAWEITHGHPDIVLNFVDNWEGTSTHPDVLPNFLRIASQHNGGAKLTAGLGWGHGLSVMSCAVAQAQFDVPASANLSMVGTCPECKATRAGEGQALIIDVDELDNGIRKIPDILSTSVGCATPSAGGWPRQVFNRAIQDGVVAIAASGNSWNDKQGFFYTNDSLVGPSGNRWSILLPSYTLPAAQVVVDPSNDPKLDAKVISVGPLWDGTEYDSDCNLWHTSNSTGQGDNWRGYEQLPPAQTFGPGKLKFNRNASTTIRAQAKADAFVDVVVPSGRIAAVDGPLNSNSYLAKYEVFHAGSSQSAPTLAGVVGLMLSINPKMNVTGAAVQRRVYDIVTFTADKILDTIHHRTDVHTIIHRIENQDVPRVVQFASQNPDGTAFQLQYVDQTGADVNDPDDPLRRWWAQRMGFGKLNAYRSVAHAIPSKAPDRYTSAASFPFGITTTLNESGVQLLHMGAYRRDDNDARVEVLSVGGVSLPSESYRNQGATTLTGTNIVLTVAEAVHSGTTRPALLAIDGLVTTASATSSNRIETGTNGRILVEGYISNVQIKGNLRLGDVTFDATSASSLGTGMSIGMSGATAEIYGDVRFEQFANASVKSGTTVVRPGGRILLDGIRDLVIDNDGRLELDSRASVIGPSTRRIVVRAGCTLSVREGAQVDIDVPVFVESGGTFEIAKDAVVRLERFTVLRNADLIVREGARVELFDPNVTNICFGRMKVLGQAARRATVTGEIKSCCSLVCSTPESRARINVRDQIGTSTNTNPCNLQLRYADFRNVSINAVDVPLYTLVNVKFTGSRELMADGTFFSTSLGMSAAQKAYVAGQSEPIRGVARLLYCEFADEDDVIAAPTDGDNYSVSGLYAMSMKRVSIANCSFGKLNVGVDTEQCDSVAVSSSQFANCRRGIGDQNSGLRVCDDEFDAVEFPIHAEGSRTSVHYANELYGAVTGFFAQAGGPHYFRGNTINNSKASGLATSIAALHLDRAPTRKFKPNWEYFGRNEFNYTVPTDGIVADIRMRDRLAWVWLQCGYNKFAAQDFDSDGIPTFHSSHFHLYSDAPKTLPVGYNEFRDTSIATSTWSVIKNPPLTVVNTPINVSATLSGCGRIVSTTACTPLPVYGSGSGWTDGLFLDELWSDLATDDLVLDTVFADARSRMADTSLPEFTRLGMMNRAMEVAVLTDSVVARLALLETDYASLYADSSLGFELRSTAQLLRAEGRERIGDIVGARSLLTIVMTEFADSEDSIRASWRDDRLAIADLDSANGKTYDSATGRLRSRIAGDLRRLSAFPVSLPKPSLDSIVRGGSTLSMTVSTTVADVATFRYVSDRSGEVVVSLTDVRGERREVYRGSSVAAGLNELAVDVSLVPSGVHIVELRVADRTIVEKIRISR